MTPLPPGFRIELDPAVRVLDRGRELVGGTPPRRLRLTEAGRVAVAALREGSDDSRAARALGRRLVDAGLAAAVPPPLAAAADVTVVVPVRDRPQELDRCLAAVGDVTVVVVDDGSRDAAATADVCRRHGATLVRLHRPHGPAAARNAALPLVRSELVAFVDSDCVPEPRWLERLAAHFADPLAGAVAPRIRAVAEPRRAVRARFLAARAPLDMGPRGCDVVAGGPVPYVPSAALLVRRSLLAEPFDPALRYGEDVDLVWRLHDGGWRVRYDASVAVAHSEPNSWRGVLVRRYRYGRSAAPLSLRHPRRLVHVVLPPLPAAAAALAVARRPAPALAVAAVHAVALALRGSSSRLLGRAAVGTGATAIGLGRAATTLAAPALALGLARRGARASALALLLAPPATEWLRRRPQLDPVRWTLASVADDVAYGLGVWRGCLAERTLRPVRPATKPYHDKEDRP